jgi:hypothetical protein
MRPGVVIIVLLAGLAGITGIFFLNNLVGQPQPAVAPISLQEIKSAAKAAPATNKPVALNHVEPVFPTGPVDTNALAEEHEQYVQEHIEKLQDLQSEDDPQSLQAILAELTNSDKKIREAAIEATVQFGSRDAIPVLRNLAAYTDDVDEKKELLDAAKFLELPTLSEVRAQNPDVKMQNTVPPQNPPAQDSPPPSTQP